jgi:hypothetical protein
MKRVLEILMVAVVVVLVSVIARAADMWPLSAQEAMMHPGSTHCVEFSHESLTETTDNAVQTNSTLFTVAANTAVRLIEMVLVTPFDDSLYTGDNSTLLTVGDGTDADYYLTSTELNDSLSTAVYLKEGRSTWNTTGLTNGVVLDSGMKVYTSADTIDFAFTPATGYDLEDLTSGKVRCFFRITQRETK